MEFLELLLIDELLLHARMKFLENAEGGGGIGGERAEQLWAELLLKEEEHTDGEGLVLIPITFP